MRQCVNQCMFVYLRLSLGLLLMCQDDVVMEGTVFLCVCVYLLISGHVVLI